MRLLALILVASVAASAAADRVLTVPTARKLPFGTVRYEYRRQPISGGAEESLFGIGIGTTFELELRSAWTPDNQARGTFDLAYNVIAPIPDFSPGIAFGVQDALDETAEGRRGFLAVTFRPIFSTATGDVPADITLGMFQGHRTTPYVGVALPFAKQVRILAEHNGRVPAVGLEIRPRANLGLRAQVQGARSSLGFQYSTRF